MTVLLLPVMFEEGSLADRGVAAAWVGFDSPELLPKKVLVKARCLSAAALPEGVAEAVVGENPATFPKKELPSQYSNGPRMRRRTSCCCRPNYYGLPALRRTSCFLRPP